MHLAYWSVAQTKNRETTAEGIGWELFKNYLIARDKYKPDYFLYENNKSMSAAIREQITKELGVEPVLINSALVSAQSRQRLYWAGKRNPDGTYSQVQIEQPEDRGILLRDILETGYPLRDDYNEAIPHFQYFEVNENPQKTNCLSTVEKDNMVAVPVRVGDMPNAEGVIRGGQAHRIYDSDGKAVTLTARPNGGGVDGPLYATPVLAEHAVDAEKNQTVSRSIDEIVEKKGYLPEMFNPYNRAEIKEKSPTLSTGSMVTSSCATLVVEELEKPDAPVRIGTIENAAKNPDHDSQQYRVYSPDGKAVTLCGNGGGLGAKTGLYATPVAPPMRVREATKQGYVYIQPGECVDLSMPNSKTRRGRAMKDKSNCLTTSCAFYEYCGTLDAPVYKVKDGKITVKGKEYPIKLRDGCYIIRKLTVTECKRLQTVPDEFVFPVSDSQAYKMLGNGWTVDVIAHIMSHFEGLTTEPIEVLSMYDGMSCGHIALDKLGADITRYYAAEIDKYAIQTTQANFPDTVQLGDAFQVRDAGWSLPGGRL